MSAAAAPPVPVRDEKYQLHTTGAANHPTRASADDTLHGNGVGAGKYGGGADLGRQLSTVTLTPEQFERLYLQPRDPRLTGDLPKRFGNPTPLGIASFTVCTTTLAGDLLNFRGADATSPVAQVGAYWFLGGIGLMLSGLLEFFIGNTFPFTVFVTFGAFWLSFASIVHPPFAVAATLGDTSEPFNSGVAWYLLVWGILSFAFLVASFRTNLVLVWILSWIMVTFFVLSGAYFSAGRGGSNTNALFKTGGALAFICAMGGWYLLFVLLFEAVRFPMSLPVGDLSNKILIRPTHKKTGSAA